MSTQPTTRKITHVPSVLGEHQFIGSGHWARAILLDFAAATIEVAARPPQGDSESTEITWAVPNAPLTAVTALVDTLVPHADEALAGARVRDDVDDVDDGVFRVAFTDAAEEHLKTIDKLVGAFYRRWTGRPMPYEVISDCAGCGKLIRCSAHLTRWVGDRDERWQCPAGGAHRPVDQSLPRGPRMNHRPFHDIDAFTMCGAWEAKCECGGWSFTGRADRVRVEYFLHVEQIPPGAPFDPPANPVPASARPKREV